MAQPCIRGSRRVGPGTSEYEVRSGTAVPCQLGHYFRLVILRLPNCTHDRVPRRERAEEDVDVEGVEPPPDERGGEELGWDRAAEGGAEGHFDGAAAPGGGDDRCAV